MTFMKNALKVGLTTALAVSLSTTAWAKKCKDGETTEVAAYTVEKGKTMGAAINKSLTGKAGDPKNGLKTMVHRRQGNCIACHKITKVRELAKPGDLKAFKKISDVIIANRMTDDIVDVKNKVYTRDIFGGDS
ncbi:MAG: hypothetical protein L3J47_11200 [Sulfurovum sp.]|nr:hypothetical protein [Sulfurovum sp.]